MNTIACAERRIVDGSRTSFLHHSWTFAVTAALGAEDLLVVKGPPGTGRTSFITELVVQFMHINPSARVLLVSKTHVTVDNALQRLEPYGPQW